MADIYLGLLLLLVLASLGFWLALRLVQSGPAYRCELLAVFTCLLMGEYIVSLWNHFTLAKLLPYANLIVIGNWFLPFGGFMAGLAWHRIHGHPLRRLLITASLPVIGLYSVLHPLLGEAPACAEQWQDDICMQTARNTCSPASAATLLRAHGIAATEQEMAELCLTRQGTTWAGLYRGLKHKTRGTEWDVEFFEGSLDDLYRRMRYEGRPVILSVGISEDTPLKSVYVEEWGLIPGQPHSVVAFHFVTGKACVIGDPAIGREHWQWADLRRVWHGQGIRLVPRRDSELFVAGRTFSRAW